MRVSYPCCINTITFQYTYLHLHKFINMNVYFLLLSLKTPHLSWKFHTFLRMTKMKKQKKNIIKREEMKKEKKNSIEHQ